MREITSSASPTSKVSPLGHSGYDWESCRDL